MKNQTPDPHFSGGKKLKNWETEKKMKPDTKEPERNATDRNATRKTM